MELVVSNSYFEGMGLLIQLFSWHCVYNLFTQETAINYTSIVFYEL